jgi:4-hydroxy-tetrahydrodipicolinate synthase
MNADKNLEDLTGAFPVLPTPMNDDQSLDMDGLREVLGRVLNTGIKGITVLGSSSEATYLTDGEKKEILGAVVKQASGRAKILAGVVRFGTNVAVEEARMACDQGADGLMVALPVYFRVTFDDVVRHFEAIVEASGVPVIYYHYPEPTGLGLKPRQMARLFEKVNLVGIKESSFSNPEMRKHLKMIKRPIKVFTGLSFNLLAAFSAGAVGSICPLAVLMPKTSLEIFQARERGDKHTQVKCLKRFFKGLPFVTPGAVPPAVARSALKFGMASGVSLPKPPGVPHSGVKQGLASLGIIRSAQIRDPQPRLSEKKKEELGKLAPQIVEL